MISIRDLSKHYNSSLALDNVSIDINESEVFALLGPNGSGKTTFLKCMLGLVIPDSGEKLIFESAGYPENLISHVGYMPQNPQFPVDMSVSETLDFLETLSAGSRYRRELEMEFGVNRYLNKKMKDLSQGMRQKVNIVQCFSPDCNIFILDEPTAGLDPGASHTLKELILDRKNNGGTVIFTTHIMSEVKRLAERMCILVNGSIIAQNTPDGFIENAGVSSLEEAVRIYWDSVSITSRGESL